MYTGYWPRVMKEDTTEYKRSAFEVISRPLESEKVYLTPLKGDINNHTDWMNNVEVTNMLGRGNKVVTKSDEEDFLKHCNGKPYYDINITCEGQLTYKHVGTCSLVVLDDAARHAILGICIGDTKNHGKGIGRAAVDMLLEIAFMRMNLESVSLTAVEDNIKAIKCYEACGFKMQGIQRNRAYVNGEYKNLVYMDIMKSEYISRKRGK